MRVAHRGGRGDRLVRAAPRRRAGSRGARDHARRAGRGVQALLRWTSSSCCGARRCGARSPRGSCSRTATSSSTARRPRRRRSRARRRAASRSPAAASLGIGSLRGGAGMSHLLREHAPITETAWAEIDDEARERLTPALAARKLVDFAGPHGWEHSATNLGRTSAARRRAGRRRRGARSAACCRWWSCACRSRCRATSCATPTAARTTSTSARSTRPPAASRPPRTAPCSTAGRPPASPASPRPRRTTRSRSATTATCTRATWRRAVETLLPPGVDGPYGLALGPEAYTRVLETTEHGGYPLLDHLRKIVGGPLVWAPGVRRRGRAEPCAAATSSSRPARTSRSATTRHDADDGRALPGGELHASASPRPRRRSR